MCEVPWCPSWDTDGSLCVLGQKSEISDGEEAEPLMGDMWTSSPSCRAECLSIPSALSHSVTVLILSCSGKSVTDRRSELRETKLNVVRNASLHSCLLGEIVLGGED